MAEVMKIDDILKNFINNHSDQINLSTLHKELVQDAINELTNNHQKQLFGMLKSIGVDLEDHRWYWFDYEFKKVIDEHASKPYSPDDRSGSWSRLHYLLEETNLIGFTYDEITNHLKQPDIQKKLNITLTPLEDGYGWYGSGDYDLGWFKKNIFRKEYPEEFED